MSTYLGIFYAFTYNLVTGVVFPPFPNPLSAVTSTSPIVSFDWPQSHFIDTFDLPLDNILSGNRSLNSGQSVSLSTSLNNFNAESFFFMLVEEKVFLIIQLVLEFLLHLTQAHLFCMI